MRIAVTGTPGTGKTTATRQLDRPVLHLNELIEDENLSTGTDEERGSLVADIDGLRRHVEQVDDETDGVVVFESHLAHHVAADRVVVLRCHPTELTERLESRAGTTDRKITENADAEALDVVLSEAVEGHGLDSVYEIDTTGKEPEAVAEAIEAVIDGLREPTAGTVSFVDYL
ncbi:MAG: adenylate kinase family protein [Natronomonas sp.]